MFNSVFQYVCQRSIFSSKSMPKRQANQGQTVASTSDREPVTEKDGSVLIKILAKPGAKTNTITDIGVEEVGVQIAAPLVDGEANTELIKYLSKLFGLRKSQVSLDKGSRSRNKTVIVEGSSKQAILTQLRTEINQK